MWDLIVSVPEFLIIAFFFFFLLFMQFISSYDIILLSETWM